MVGTNRKRGQACPLNICRFQGEEGNGGRLNVLLAPILTGAHPHGTIELRKYVELDGRPVSDHLFLVDRTGPRHIDCSQEALTYFRGVVAAVGRRSEVAMRQAHVFSVGAPRAEGSGEGRAPSRTRTTRRQKVPSSMKKIGLAIIGLGPASQPHSKSLLDLSDRIDVHWAASRSPERVQAYQQQFPFRTTTDLDAAIQDPAVNAVLVLTPPSSHLEVSKRCFAAGKHVLVEKPLELTLDRAEQLVAAAQAAGVTFGVVLQQRFRLGSLRLRHALLSGEIGMVQAGFLSVPWWRPQSYYDEPGRGTLARDGGGVLLTQAIHSLDLFRSLVGVSSVIAADVRTTDLHRMETEDYVSALLRLGNGSPGTLMATTAAYPGHPERIEVIGTKGFASLIGGTLRLSFLDGREAIVEAEGSTGSGASIMDFPHDAHRALITDFADAIHDRRQPIVSGEEALESQRLISAVLGGGKSAQYRKER
jgi:predicted dehydrogenase